jgi:hypothetical protein
VDSSSQKKHGHMTLFVFKDSLLIIKAIITQSNLGGNKLQGIVSRIKQGLTQLDHVSLFHIKGNLNGEVDVWTKFSTSINLGTIMEYGVSNYFKSNQIIFFIISDY